MASPGGSNNNNNILNNNIVIPAGEPVSISEDRCTAAIITSVKAEIRDDDRLRADGSNYAAWKDFLESKDFVMQSTTLTICASAHSMPRMNALFVPFLSPLSIIVSVAASAFSTTPTTCMQMSRPGLQWLAGQRSSTFFVDCCVLIYVTTQPLPQLARRSMINLMPWKR
jgi:hypothetical protein